MPTTVRCPTCRAVAEATSVSPTARHACNAPGTCGCTGRHSADGGFIAPASALPRQDGRGCTWFGPDPTTCVTHDSPLVLVPMPHTTAGESHTRMCRHLLEQASQCIIPEPPQPTVVDQLVRRMNDDANGAALLQLTSAARHALAALPAFDDATVEALAATAAQARHPNLQKIWEDLSPTARLRWTDSVRAVLDALAKAAE